MQMFSKVLDMVLPPRCVVSGEAVVSQGMISAKAWQALSFIEDPMCKKCGMPFDFLSDDGDMECAACAQFSPRYDRARSALSYNDASRDMILGFKHADKMHYVSAFIPWLTRAGADLLKEADYIVPVPLHYWRMVKRRYNQAQIIGKSLSKETKIPMIADVLQRVRPTKTQGHLSPREREKNVKKAFAVHPKYRETIEDKTIVLIDDVYTTGATVNECAKVLKGAGVGAVHVLTLARVVK